MADLPYSVTELLRNIAHSTYTDVSISIPALTTIQINTNNDPGFYYVEIDTRFSPSIPNRTLLITYSTDNIIDLDNVYISHATNTEPMRSPGSSLIKYFDSLTVTNTDTEAHDLDFFSRGIYLPEDDYHLFVEAVTVASLDDESITRLVNAFQGQTQTTQPYTGTEVDEPVSRIESIE